MSTALDVPATRTRSIAIARVHAQNWQIAFVWPVGILAVIAVITWAVLASADGGAEIDTGGATFVFFFGMVLFAQGIAQFLPFTMGMGVTRREFFLSTIGVAVVHALIYGVGLSLLSVIERSTDGFGVGMIMFSLAHPLAGNTAVELAFFVAATGLCNIVGMLFGAIYLRWRVTGMWAFGTAVTVVIGALIVLITWQGWWTSLGSAVADTPRPITMVLLPLVAAVAAAPGVWAVLRRTTV